MCRHVVVALQHLKLYADRIKDVEELSKGPVQCSSCNMVVTFTEDNLFLGSKPHNHPLFVIGYIREQKVNRIFVDGGLAVNITPRSTMNDLCISIEELSKIRTTIHVFDLDQCTIGMICVKITIEDLSTSLIFHVIDAKTLCKLLLGRL